MYAPPFQTLVDSVCTDLDKHARISGVGRRYRAPPVSDDAAASAGAGANAINADMGDDNNENLVTSVDSSAAAAHGLLFGGGAAPKNGPSFAIFAHLSSTTKINSDNSAGASSPPGIVTSPVPSPLVASEEPAPSEGWEAKLGDLAGGIGSMQRTGARVERLKILAACGTQKLTQEFATLSQEVRVLCPSIISSLLVQLVAHAAYF